MAAFGKAQPAEPAWEAGGLRESPAAARCRHSDAVWQASLWQPLGCQDQNGLVLALIEPRNSDRLLAEQPFGHMG